MKNVKLTASEQEYLLLLYLDEEFEERTPPDPLDMEKEYLEQACSKMIATYGVSTALTRFIAYLRPYYQREIKYRVEEIIRVYGEE
jgi:hypothetical protein